MYADWTSNSSSSPYHEISERCYYFCYEKWWNRGSEIKCPKALQVLSSRAKIHGRLLCLQSFTTYLYFTVKVYLQSGIHIGRFMPFWKSSIRDRGTNYTLKEKKYIQITHKAWGRELLKFMFLLYNLHFVLSLVTFYTFYPT